MHAQFRKSLAMLHTWTGVFLGSLLFAIFWMGSLSTFDREIDRWMQPGTRLPYAQSLATLDSQIVPTVQALASKSPQWGLSLPTDRVAHIRLTYRDSAGQNVARAINPETGQLIADQGSLAGTGFIFPFHFRLHIRWMDLGYWLVGLAGMAMLVLITSGVIIHRKIFADFFLFRPRKQTQRASLDLHNLTGVLGLPFHFLIALSGLIIFIQIYFPHAYIGTYGQGKEARSTFQAEAFGRYSRPKANQSAPLASMDAMVAAAEREWSGGKPYFIRVWHPGDAASYVEVRRSFAHDVTMNLDQIYFDGKTGAVLKRFEASPSMGVQRFISGMHFIQFNHWGIRWLYLLAGLSGCIMIATGLIFWLESRRAAHAKKGLVGVRVVEALTIGSVTGILIATAAFMVVNRLLPLGVVFAGQGRAEIEVWVFYLVWLSTFIHAAWRCFRTTNGEIATRGWNEQCVIFAGLCFVAVSLNSFTTKPFWTYVQMHDWQVVGVDAMLILAGGVALLAAKRLRRTQKTSPKMDHALQPFGESHAD
jgi:uncharacterized iron-regulated membrane protein